jgi:hypothetical protein
VEAVTADDALRRLIAGLAEDERVATEAAGVWSDDFAGNFEAYGVLGEDVHAHAARQDPKATLRRVEAIRESLIAPYLAASGAVEATMSARRDAVTRYTLAAIRLDHGGGDEMEERQAQERRTREELLSAEVQLASDAAKRDAYSSVIAALASIYSEDTTETGEQP